MLFLKTFSVINVDKFVIMKKNTKIHIEIGWFLVSLSLWTCCQRFLFSHDCWSLLIPSRVSSTLGNQLLLIHFLEKDSLMRLLFPTNEITFLCYSKSDSEEQQRHERHPDGHYICYLPVPILKEGSLFTFHLTWTPEFSSEMFYINSYLGHLVYVKMQGSKVFYA